MSRKSIFVTASALLFSLLALNLSAQNQEKRKQLTPEQRTEHRLERMKKDLSLTDEQSAKAKEVILSQEKARETESNQMRENHKKLNDDLDKILTSEQRDKRETMMKERREKMKEQRHERRMEKKEK
jgi:Spy/CpxP family protein refolding chaperone